MNHIIAWVVVTMMAVSVIPTAQAQQGCRLISVDAKATNICVYGSGETTVVLAAGAGQTSRTWSGIIPHLSKSHRVITFDRAGFGGSELRPSPRTPSRIASELNQTLLALDISAKLVLVGHSMGGVHMLSFADQYPEQVKAIVLLDTPPKGFEELRRTLLSAAEREERNVLLENGLTNMPTVIRLEREGAKSTNEWEFDGFRRDTPLFVVVGDSQDFGSQGSQSAHRNLWTSESQKWLLLSERSYFEIAKGSGHMIHHDRQQLVVNTIIAAAALSN